MIIGFIGAASTGKTSAAKEVAKKTGLPFHPSVSREVFEKFGLKETDQKNMSPEKVAELQSAIFDRKIEQDSNVSEGIFDRTPVDQMSYSMIRCHSTMGRHFKDLRDRMIDGLKIYDLLFFFPISPMIAYEDDGFREASGDAYRYLQQFTMRGLLHVAGVEFQQVTPTSSLRTRVINICRTIEMKERQQQCGTTKTKEQ
jgi:nicotinamide riboside kinase